MMPATDPAIGRREAHRRATRDAILTAARRLFGERGYQDTTVRSIAEAAGTTERTFYRYFEGKEGLLADNVALWIDKLTDAIVDRPASEGAMTAVRGAMVELSRQIAVGDDPAPIWMFTDGPRPFELLQHSAPRPQLRFERAIAEAILTRRRRDDAGHHKCRDVDAPAGEQRPPTPDDLLDAELTARVCVAVLRTAAIHRRRADPAQAHPDPPIGELLDAAFDRLTVQLGGQRSPSPKAR